MQGKENHLMHDNTVLQIESDLDKVPNTFESIDPPQSDKEKEVMVT